MKLIRLLARSIREYKKNAILTPVFVSLEVVVDTLIPFTMTFLLKCFQSEGQLDLTPIFIYGGIIVALAFVALLLGALSGMQCAIASSGFARNLRKDMFYRIQTYSFNNLDKFSNASLITRMTTDVSFVQQAFMMIIRIAVRSPLVLIFAVIMSVVIGGPMALIYVGIIPFMAALLIIIFANASKHFKKLFKKYDKLNNVVEENISGMRVVKSNVQEAYETEKFNETSQDIYRIFSKAQGIVVLTSPVMQLSMYTCITLIFYFGAHAILGEGILDLEELSALITYAMQVLMSLMMLSMIFVQTVIAKSSAERICEVLTETPDIVNPENAVKSVADGSIDFEGVSFKYDVKAELNSLSDINLHIKSGETIGVIGSTGSGKTTFVQLIPRLYDVTEGTLKVGGVKVSDYDIKALRSSVAMVLQKNVLFSGTVKENLLWGKEDATDEDIARALKISESSEFIEKIGGLEAHVEQAGANLSGGQRQRLCIARAIIGSPKILIMDDSTSAVDMATDMNIRKAFKDFMPDTTKIIIAQRVASVASCDRIVVMDGGRINGVGTHDELMENNVIYREVFESQNNKGGDFDVVTN